MKVLMNDTQKIVEVNTSYAVNYLIPKGLAIVATAHVIAKKDKKEAIQVENVQNKKSKEGEFASKIHGKKFVFKTKANSEGELFGGVGKAQIKKVLKSKLKIRIMIDHPIKHVGEHKIPIRIGEEKAVIIFEIVAL